MHTHVHGAYTLIYYGIGRSIYELLYPKACRRPWDRTVEYAFFFLSVSSRARARAPLSLSLSSLASLSLSLSRFSLSLSLWVPLTPSCPSTPHPCFTFASPKTPSPPPTDGRRLTAASRTPTRKPHAAVLGFCAVTMPYSMRPSTKARCIISRHHASRTTFHQR